MRSERWLKPFVRIIAVLILLVVAGAALLYYELSSFSKMHSDFAFKVAPTAAPKAVAETEAAPEAPRVNAQGQPLPAPTPFKVKSGPLDAATAYLVDRFAANNGRIDVCGQLANQPQPARRPPSMGQASPDPSVESSFMPIAHFLQLPSVQRVTVALANAHTSGDASEISTPEFKQQVDAAAAEVTTHQEELAAASQAAYNLFALSRAVEMVPQMGSNTEVQDFCSRQQDMALGSSSVTKEQVEEDKARLFRILSNAGLGPDDVEYDPRIGARIESIANAQGLRFSTAWLGSVTGGGFELMSPLATPDTTSGATTQGEEPDMSDDQTTTTPQRAPAN